MKKAFFFLIFIISVFLLQCQRLKKDQQLPPEKTQKPEPDSLAIRNTFSESPFLSPDESIKKMQIEDGYEVKLLVSEPLISTPIALTFDFSGRIWVIEMNGYMTDIEGSKEGEPLGKIVILEDQDEDGVMDERKVFLDSLVMPRAICLIEDGILVAEPPNLWYYKIENDRPGKRTLVDKEYAVGGNVEHQPNGLLRALDNWIYNAKSDKRYQKRGNDWVVEKTHYRGQWGIAQDNYGRLYSNDNSTNLRGDYFSPGFGAKNKNQPVVGGFNENIVNDNRVYPARPNTGVNRAYLDGFLDNRLRLVHFTAASAPIIYRGGLFGTEDSCHAFVPEPAANLIKKNILREKEFAIEGTQAYKGKEFLSSFDERFRPVSLYNAPDGALYVVDMYRGIIQHKTFLTPYLKREIAERDLSAPVFGGRIYKIAPVNHIHKTVRIPENVSELVDLLGHVNGWVRDHAQQKLVDNKRTGAIPSLRRNLHESNNSLKVIHSIWTLEGLGALKENDVVALLKHKDWHIRTQALSVLPSILNSENYPQFVTLFHEMIDNNDANSAPYIAFLASFLDPLNEEIANKLLHKLAEKFPENRFVSAAIISSLHGREEIFQKELLTHSADTSLAIHKQLNEVINGIKNKESAQRPEQQEIAFPVGASMYATKCQACHGEGGDGVASLAPPLNRSEWVTGGKNKLIAIVLYGLTGPIEVNGHVYKAPEINMDMPGIGYDKNLTDEDIAELLSFIRNSWSNNADKVDTEEVRQLREKLKDREKSFTVEELNHL